MNHSLRKHRKFAASAAHRWLHCTASIPLAEGLPETPSGPAAREGTFAHEILECALRNRIRNAEDAYVFMYDQSGGSYLPEKREWLQPAYDGVQIALDYIFGILDAYPGATLLTETEVRHVSAYVSDTGGTLDCCIIIWELGIGYIVDYKHGFDVVDAINNEQERVYAECFHSMQGDAGYRLSGFIGTIIQPRAFKPTGPIDEHFYKIEEIEMFGRLIDFTVSEIDAGRTKFAASEKTCKYCPARSICPEQERIAATAVGETFRTVQTVSKTILPEPRTLPLDRIGYILSASDILSDWFKEVKSIAYEYARQGYHIPGYKLVESQAKREWIDAPQTVVSQLATLTGKAENDIWQKDLPTIGDMEKAVKAFFKTIYPELKAKDIGEAVTQALAPLTIKQSRGGLVLAPVTDSRPAAPIGNSNQFSSVSIPDMRETRG